MLRILWQSEKQREREWSLAKKYLTNRANGAKLRRKSEKTTYSFILFNKKIVAIDRKEYLNKSFKSLTKIAEDEERILYVLKKLDWEDNVAGEFEIANDLGSVIGYAERDNCKKYLLLKYWGIDLYSCLLHANLNSREEYALAIKITLLLYALHSGISSKSQKKYAHLDIKPNNIVKDRIGGLHLIDFDTSEEAEKTLTTTPYLYQPFLTENVEAIYIDTFSLLRTLYCPKNIKYYDIYTHKIETLDRDQQFIFKNTAKNNSLLLRLIKTEYNEIKEIQPLQLAFNLVLLKNNISLSLFEPNVKLDINLQKAIIVADRLNILDTSTINMFKIETQQTLSFSQALDFLLKLEAKITHYIHWHSDGTCRFFTDDEEKSAEDDSHFENELNLRFAKLFNFALGDEVNDTLIFHTHNFFDVIQKYTVLSLQLEKEMKKNFYFLCALVYLRYGEEVFNAYILKKGFHYITIQLKKYTQNSSYFLSFPQITIKKSCIEILNYLEKTKNTTTFNALSFKQEFHTIITHCQENLNKRDSQKKTQTFKKQLIKLI